MKYIATTFYRVHSSTTYLVVASPTQNSSNRERCLDRMSYEEVNFCHKARLLEQLIAFNLIIITQLN